MSFVEDGEEVRREVEPLIKQLAADFAGKKLLSRGIPRIPYAEAMERYGSDKPDLRFGMELVDLTSVFSRTEFGVFKNAECIKAICVSGGANLSRKQIDTFTAIAKSEGAGGLAYITVERLPDLGLNSVDPVSAMSGLKSPILKFFSSEEVMGVLEATGAQSGDAIFFGADTRVTVNAVLGRLRNEFATHFNLKDPNVVALAWIVDFPFYEWDDARKKLDFGHNPFSMPRGGEAALDAATTDKQRLEVVADQFDMVMNGYEICSGGVRNHNPAVLYKAFENLGYNRAYVDAKFGAMINAFKYGAPPHAGCAFGVDRILMELLNEENVREVLAFPKNGSGLDVMMSSPSAVEPGQLRELGL